MIAYTVRHVPKWNPINVCSYHLQEAGPRRCRRSPTRWPPPSASSTPCATRARSTPTSSPAVVGRISFFVNAGIRFVEETCKMRAFTAHVGPHLPGALRRRGPEAAPLPLRRAGQLARADRGPAREQRAAHRARDARRHPVQATPGPGPSSCRRGTRRSGLPRPWDQQWSLRIQQILAYETDLLEYDDIFEGSTVIEAKTAELAEAADGRARRRPRPSAARSRRSTS